MFRHFLSPVYILLICLNFQYSDHLLFYKEALEDSLRDQNFNAFNQLIRHFGFHKKISWIRSVILDVISYSFHIKYYNLIRPIIKSYGKQDEFLDYLKLIVENMVKYSITTQTFKLIDPFSKRSDLSLLVKHAIKVSIQESKIDAVKFIIHKYGIPSSFKLYIFLAIQISVSLSKFDIIQNFIQNFGLNDQYNEYFETAIMSCLHYSNFTLISQYKTVYGNAISDEAFIMKTIDLGIRMELYHGLKVFIKEIGNPIHYLDYISLIESMKGLGNVEKNSELIDYITSFYFNQ